MVTGMKAYDASNGALVPDQVLLEFDFVWCAGHARRIHNHSRSPCLKPGLKHILHPDPGHESHPDPGHEPHPDPGHEPHPNNPEAHKTNRGGLVERLTSHAAAMCWGSPEHWNGQRRLVGVARVSTVGGALAFKSYTHAASSV